MTFTTTLCPVGCLATLPDLTQQHPSLVSLITSLKLESTREAADITVTMRITT